MARRSGSPRQRTRRASAQVNVARPVPGPGRGSRRRWIKEVIEVATEDPGCVHGHTMDEALVDQIRAGVMRRADSLADLSDTPSGQIQADEKGLGESGVELGP